MTPINSNETQTADAVFLYGAFRPDDLGDHEKQWVIPNIIGINGQRAVLERALLFDSGYNPDLVYYPTIQEHKKVYGWVMQHKNPRIFKQFFDF